MPLPRELSDELERKRSEEHRLASRDRRRHLVFVAVMCWFWLAVGMLAVLWSFHTTVLWLGRAAFWGGLAVGNGGISYTLLAAYRRGESRGDW